MLMAENARTGFVWNTFMRNPEARRGMQRAGSGLRPVRPTHPLPLPLVTIGGMIATGPEIKEKKPHLAGLRTVAMLEFTKGVVVLALGWELVLVQSRRGLLRSRLGSSGWPAPESGASLSRYFLDLAGRLDAVNMKLVALGALGYSILRFLEAYGLWNGLVWAEWFALLSGAGYLPFEIYGLLLKATPIRWLVLIVNLIIVIYMAYIRIQARWSRAAPDEDSG